MKILFYCPFNFNLNTSKKNFLGGIESLNVTLATELAKKKNIIYLASHTNNVIKSNNVINIPIKNLVNNRHKFDFDCIISSNDTEIFDLFKFSKKFFWMHNTLSLEKAFRKKKLISLITNKITTIFVSKFLKNKTSSLYFFNKKIVIPNFLTEHFILKKKMKSREPIFVWSVQRDKGLTNVIDLWISKIHKNHKKAKFYIFGVDKIPFNYSRNKLISSNIYFFGKVRKDLLIKVYSKSMAMICLGYDETFCLNAIEANACGLPVISLGKTSLNEIISNNRNGFILNNLNELEDKINNIINLNTQKRKLLTRNSYYFSKKFHLKKIIHLWLKLLK